MAIHLITIAGQTFPARGGELLLDAALRSGVAIPHQCRAGHCGTCCVRLVSGVVSGGEAAEPGVVHACQCRISGNAVIEGMERLPVRTLEGVLARLQPLSREVFEISIRTHRAFPHHPGQFAQVQFSGYPSRPYSVTLPLHGRSQPGCVSFHIRRFGNGCVTSALGIRIKPGHKVSLTGPWGGAHFRPGLLGRRLICVGSNTGFAPIWSIALAALREDWRRSLMVIVGGRTSEALYMGPALSQLAGFPNVRIVPSCSAQRLPASWMMPGRPTDYLPPLFRTDVLYACGAPPMVDGVRSLASRAGATCYADPFMPASDVVADTGPLTRARSLLASLNAAW